MTTTPPIPACKCDGLNILLIGRLTEGSGNKSTAERIQSYFVESRHTCLTKEAESFIDVDDFNKYVREHRIDCVLGIHALRSGRVLLGSTIPYALIFGGTDLNEFIRDENAKEVISEAVSKARYLVAFSTPMLQKAFKIWPNLEEKKLVMIPQAVKTSPSARCSVDWKVEHGLPHNCLIFSLIAGLREVKDPLHVVHAFTRWHQSVNRRACLVIVGPELDKAYSLRFKSVIAECPGVIYLGLMSIYDTHRIIADSFALVNTSISEGMPSCILEAQDLGVPVIARDIPENAAIITDMKTGLLYHEPQDFITKASALIADDVLRRTLVENGKQQVATRHSCQQEMDQYVQLVDALMTDITTTIDPPRNEHTKTDVKEFTPLRNGITTC